MPGATRANDGWVGESLQGGREGFPEGVPLDLLFEVRGSEVGGVWAFQAQPIARAEASWQQEAVSVQEGRAEEEGGREGGRGQTCRAL